MRNIILRNSKSAFGFSQSGSRASLRGFLRHVAIGLFVTLTVFAAASCSKKSSRPEWIDSPYSVYPRDRYIVTVGSGSSSVAASSNAKMEMSNLFSQRIYGASYSDTRQYVMRDYPSDWSVSSQKVSAYSFVENMIGLEIANVWKDADSDLFYALCLLDKEKTARIYNGMLMEIKANIRRLQDEAANGKTQQSRSLAAAELENEKSKLEDCQKILRFVDASLAETIAEPVHVTIDQAVPVPVAQPPMPATVIPVPIVEPAPVPVVDFMPASIGEVASRLRSVSRVDCYLESDISSKELEDTVISSMEILGLRVVRENLRAPLTLSIRTSYRDQRSANGQLAECHYIVTVEILRSSDRRILYNYSASGRESSINSDSARSRAVYSMRAKLERELKTDLEKRLFGY